MNSSSSSAALTAENLTVRLDQHTILDNLNFSIPASSATAIIGPNGAGKSVLLKTILRLMPISSGSIKIFGTDNIQYRKIAPLISYIPQQFNLESYFPLTVQGLFALKSPRPVGLSSNDETRMHKLLQLVGAEHLVNQKIATLSGGQFQRTLLAFSLMDRPRLLLLDEPAAGIDVKGQETIYQLLRRVQKFENITVVMVSHELQIVMNYSDQVLCLNKKLVCAGKPETVLTNETLKQMYGPDTGHFHHHH